jgi:ATP-dependent protease ClpP protease subunit
MKTLKGAAPIFDIKASAKAEDPVEILIYGDIGGWNEDSVLAAQFVRDLQNVDAKAIDLRINSIGGSTKDGAAIYNALVRHPATVAVHIDGLAASIASVIAMAGDSISIAENALMMIHAPWAVAMGNADDMRNAAEYLDKTAEAMASSYAKKSGKTVTEMLALMNDGEDHWYTAQEAVDAGFADNISDKVTAKAEFDLSRYRRIPAAAAAFIDRSSKMTPEQLAAKAAADAAAAVAAKAAADEAARVAAEAETKRKADEKAAADLAAARSNVLPFARTKEQNVEIRAIFDPFMKSGDQAAAVRAVYTEVLEDPSITVDGARAKLLSKIGEGQTPANPAGVHVEMGATESEKRIEAMACAVLVRAGGELATKEMRASMGANPYRGHKLLDLARSSLDRAGVDHRRMSQMEAVAVAFTQTTSDFPVLLENIMHKALQTAYGTTPDTWRKFCAIGSVSDFRASNRYRLGSFGSLDALTEVGEFKNKSIPDGEKASITAATKGNIINLSRQVIINDDLNAFVGLAAGLGRAAQRTIEVDVYALLALNSGLGPTVGAVPLFDATHGNISATGAIAVSVFDDARVKMASQRDVSLNDYLDLRPSVLVLPIGSGGAARVINGSQFDTEVSSKFQVPNKVVGLFQTIVDTPRLSGTRFYMFADPQIAPTLEVAFLDGNQEPYIELQQGFDVDGARYKVRLDYGTAAIDYRGAVTGAGA